MKKNAVLVAIVLIGSMACASDTVTVGFKNVNVAQSGWDLLWADSSAYQPEGWYDYYSEYQMTTEKEILSGFLCQNSAESIRRIDNATNTDKQAQQPYGVENNAVFCAYAGLATPGRQASGRKITSVTCKNDKSKGCSRQSWPKPQANLLL